MSQFVYQRPSPDNYRQRAAMGGGSYDSYIVDGVQIFIPAKGSNWIRILPGTWEGAGHYGLDIYCHYNVGPNRGRCLCLARMASQPCPVCQGVIALQRAGDDDLAREISARKQVLIWMLDRSKHGTGPMVWPMPQQCDSNIAGICNDPTTGETYYIDDPYDGYDVVFNREGDRLQTRYSSFQRSGRASSVSPEDLQFIQENPLPNVLLWRTYEEIEVMFTGGVGQGAGAPPQQQQYAPAGRPPRRATTAPPQPPQQPRQLPPPNGQLAPPQPQYQHQEYAPQPQWEGHPGDPAEPYDPTYEQGYQPPHAPQPQYAPAQPQYAPAEQQYTPPVQPQYVPPVAQPPQQFQQPRPAPGGPPPRRSTTAPPPPPAGRGAPPPPPPRAPQGAPQGAPMPGRQAAGVAANLRQQYSR